MSSGWRQLIVQMKKSREESMNLPNLLGLLLTTKAKVKEEMGIAGSVIKGTFQDRLYFFQPFNILISTFMVFL